MIPLKITALYVDAAPMMEYPPNGTIAALKRSIARERILDAAYELFVRRGINSVGVDMVLKKSRSAKASLYSNFGSKTGLALAVLDRRGQLWTRQWLEAGILARASKPEEQLLAAFDLLDEWTHSRGFEGCTFLHALTESKKGGPIHRSVVKHLAAVRALFRGLATEAGLAEPEHVGQVWQMLFWGAIMLAEEGHRSSARYARRAAQQLLTGWPRVKNRS